MVVAQLAMVVMAMVVMQAMLVMLAMVGQLKTGAWSKMVAKAAMVLGKAKTMRVEAVRVWIQLYLWSGRKKLWSWKKLETAKAAGLGKVKPVAIVERWSQDC